MFSKKAPIGKLAFDVESVESPAVAVHLGAEIAARFGPREETPLSITARDAGDALIGGLNGVTHWRWLYIRHLWVARPQRGQGIAEGINKKKKKENKKIKNIETKDKQC